MYFLFEVPARAYLALGGDTGSRGQQTFEELVVIGPVLNLEPD